MKKLSKEERLRRFNREVRISQEFCSKCGGLTLLRAGNIAIQPEKWMNYGMASDIGCVC